MVNQAISPRPNLRFSQKNNSIYPELNGELNELTKCHHIPTPGALGPKNKFWVILVKMTYQPTNPETL